MGLLDSNKMFTAPQYKESVYSNKSLSTVGYIDGFASGIDARNYNTALINFNFSGSGPYNTSVRGNITNATYEAIPVKSANDITGKDISNISTSGWYYLDLSVINYFGIRNNVANSSGSVTITVILTSIDKSAVKDMSGGILQILTSYINSQKDTNGTAINIDYSDTGVKGTINNPNGKKCMVVIYSHTGSNDVKLYFERNTATGGNLPILDNYGKYSYNLNTKEKVFYVDITGISSIVLYCGGKDSSGNTSGVLNYILTDEFPTVVESFKPIQLLNEISTNSNGRFAIVGLYGIYKYFYIEGAYLVGNTLTPCTVTLNITTNNTYNGSTVYLPYKGIGTFNGSSFVTDWMENKYIGNGGTYIYINFNNTSVENGMLYLRIYGVR